ncbi:MAG: hypothetical protein K2X43_21725 [Hyphomonadaceae bacterium]|jgi:hypothetical protein|nr:hypothetical protein [Hyphomonadaceae bacterium]
MHSYASSLMSDVSPGLALAFVALLAATPPYLALHQSARGRARSAIGYLLGLGTGLAATVVSVAILGAHADAQAIVAAGLAASFFSPFVGMLRAKWRRKGRPVRSRTVVEGLSRS